MRRHHWLLAAIALIALWFWTQRPDSGGELHAPAPAAPAVVMGDAQAPQPTGSTPATRAPRYPDFLPREAHAVLDAIDRGGPYEYRQDGGVFQNRERQLPSQPRGYYREYTVETPGSRDRGARRIITGGNPPVEYFYTDDHYRSFRRFDLREGALR